MKETLKKIWSKDKYREMQGTDKYQEPSEEVKKVVEETGEDSLLKVEITESHPYEVVDAFGIESKEDMAEAMKKNPEE